MKYLPPKLGKPLYTAGSSARSSECCFMLDCGDGTNYQLQRHYGDENTDRIPSSLSFVFISHIHIDHHMVTKEFIIIGPERLHVWLKQLSSLTGTELNFRYYTFTDVKSGNLKTEMKDLLASLNMKKLSIVPVHHYYDSPCDGLISSACSSYICDLCILQLSIVSVHHCYDSPFDLSIVPVHHCYDSPFDGLISSACSSYICDLCILQLSIVPVHHCYDSHGIVLTHNSGWKLVYSGDCAPSERLWKEGLNATLLIHEATFLPEYKKTHKVKHSTFDEAIEVSKKMRARYTILTHFSQRYSLSDLFATPLAPGVSLAFDHMSVSVRLLDLPNLEKRQTRIRHMFSKKKLS
ncbi:hypothetical protein QZH41_013960, partial [Actinostola sp. cb2023]